MIFSSFAVNALCNTVKQQLRDCSACTAYDKFHVRACYTCDWLLIPDETLFELRPMYRHCIVEFPMQLVEGAPPVVIPGVQINFLQLPILANHATTVHKLQGRTVDSLFINDFNYKGNWVYVALSRLRSLDKLFLRRKLDRTQDLTPNGEIEAMLSFMRANKRLQNFPPDD